VSELVERDHCITPRREDAVRRRNGNPGRPSGKGSEPGYGLADRLRSIDAERRAAARRVIDYARVLVPLYGDGLARLFGEVLTRALEQALWEHESAERRLLDELRRITRD